MGSLGLLVIVNYLDTMGLKHPPIEITGLYDVSDLKQQTFGLKMATRSFPRDS